MDLALSDDQAAILDAIDGLARPYATMPASAHGFVLADEALDRALGDGGFLDVGFDPDLGATTAALVVERLARLPYAVEAAASALIRPLVGEAAARPVCVVDARFPERPVRFLAPGATVVRIAGADATAFEATEADVAAAATIYAYPMAMLAPGASAGAGAGAVPLDAAVPTRWRIALAAEMAGLLAAAIASTVTYVSERKQFGRPIGTFQAMRHRLAEDHVLAEGTHWLAIRAAASGDAGDAALAVAHAQDAAARVVYDLHQFLAGMGMTLEHPLHLWTYRAKALLSELGGAGEEAATAAAAIWA